MKKLLSSKLFIVALLTLGLVAVVEPTWAYSVIHFGYSVGGGDPWYYHHYHHWHHWCRWHDCYYGPHWHSHWHPGYWYNGWWHHGYYSRWWG